MESLKQTRCTACNADKGNAPLSPRPVTPPDMTRGNGRPRRGFSLNITLCLRPFTFAVHVTPPAEPATISGYTI